MYPVKMLWHCNFWDYPINGVAEYQGNKVWFEIGKDRDMDFEMTHEMFDAINAFLDPLDMKMIKYQPEQLKNIVDQIVQLLQIKYPSTIETIKILLNYNIYDNKQFEVIDVEQLLEKLKNNHDVWDICQIIQNQLIDLPHIKHYFDDDNEDLYKQIDEVLKPFGVELTRYDGLQVTTKLSYHIYQLSEDQANIITTRQHAFNTYVGYHSWHVPEINNTPHVRNDEHVEQFYNFYSKSAPGAEKYNPIDTKQLTYLNTFYYDEFEYYRR